MLKRTITGAVFCAIVVSFFLLRQFCYYQLFDILTWFFCAVGTFELARAVKDKTNKPAFIFTVIYGVLFVVGYAVSQYWLWSPNGYFVAIALCGLGLICTVLFYAFDKERENKNFVWFILPIVYPALLILTMLLINGLPKDKGFLGLLLVFVISPFCDTMAYFTGYIYNKIRKGNAKKLCPSLSPNKTVAGAIGGLIGGVVGSIVVCAIFFNKVQTLNIPLPYLIFAAIGVVGAILNQIGDLFESLIKRKIGIKDMGKIMPGHGGILDRIDGMSFTSVLVCLVFALI